MKILISSWKRAIQNPAVPGLAIAAGSALLYIPVLSFYLWGDDFQWLTLAYSLWHEPQVLFEKTLTFFRPIVRLSYFLNYALFKHKVFTYNSITIAFHGLNTFLLYTYLFRLTKKIPFAALTTALFGTSSFYSEVPIWTAVRPDSHVAACMLGTFVLFSKDRPLSKVKDWVVFVLLLFGALGSKESWMMLPLLLIIFLLLCKKYPLKRAIFETLPAFFVLGAYIGIFFVLPFLQRTDSAFSYAHPLGMQTLQTAGLKCCYLIYKYVGLGDYFYGDLWQIALLVVVWLTIISLAVVLKSRLTLWGMVWMVLTMVPTMHIYYAPSRFNYLPLMGFWIMTVAFFETITHALCRKFSIQRRYIFLFFTPCIMYLLLYHGIMVQWEIHDYRVYADLHKTIVDWYFDVQNQIPEDQPVLVMDNGTQNATVIFDRAIRGHIKMQYSKPGGLWWIIYFDQLFNYAGDPFTRIMEPIENADDIEALLQHSFTVLVFTDNGFTITQQHDDALQEFYETYKRLPRNVQAYTVRSL